MRKTEQDIRLVPFLILIIMEKCGKIYSGRMSMIVFNSSTGINGLLDFIVDEEKLTSSGFGGLFTMMLLTMFSACSSGTLLNVYLIC